MDDVEHEVEVAVQEDAGCRSCDADRDRLGDYDANAAHRPASAHATEEVVPEADERDRLEKDRQRVVVEDEHGAFGIVLDGTGDDIDSVKAGSDGRDGREQEEEAEGDGGFVSGPEKGVSACRSAE